MACEKRPFPTPITAARALRAIRRRYASTSRRLPVTIHPCVECQCWHLTSRRRSGQARWWDAIVDAHG